LEASRTQLEASVVARASSIDGRRFELQCSLHELELQPGGYVRLGQEALGQVHTVEPAWVEGAELAAALGDGAEPGAHRIALARGAGVVLEGDERPFRELPIAPADAAAVAAWLARTQTRNASLDVGALTLEPGVRFGLDAAGFNRHTFFCGQSGSGKTYALGTVLERLLLETTLRIVVLDPNSDFVRLGALREGAAPEAAARYRESARGVAVRRAGAAGADRLHVRFTGCAPEEQAAVLQLDPIRDRDEYGALVELVEQAAGAQPVDTATFARRLLESDDERVRMLGARVRNLGIHRWQIWSTGDEGSLQDLVGPDGPRCLVVDLGSLETRGEQAIAAESVLAALWRRRGDREPVLVVIDEAHNVCPRIAPDEVTELATEHAVRIAAEGRKFGLYLLVSTQRPQRVHELVVSQVDNLVLMRMNAAADLGYIADVLSFAPRALLERSAGFDLGESLVAGKIASHPALVRFGPRLSEEGGSDVPTTWASG
jgi:DNA helicase HerA-like ATPase